jgi:hypothetical protein
VYFPTVDARTAARAAGLWQIAIAAGFGIGALVTIRHLEEHGELPMTPFGFRAFAGPFETVVDQAGFVLLLKAMAGLCALDAVAGAQLLAGRRSGLRLGILTALPSFALSIGFLLPIMLIGVPLRLLLAFAGRKALR